jgi:hypothetical protein
LQAVDVLSPQAMGAPEVVVKQADDRAEWVQHEPFSNQAGRIGQPGRKTG